MRRLRKDKDVSPKDKAGLSKDKAVPRKNRSIFGGVMLFFVLIGVAMILFFLSKYLGFI